MASMRGRGNARGDAFSLCFPPLPNAVPPSERNVTAFPFVNRPCPCSNGATRPDRPASRDVPRSRHWVSSARPAGSIRGHLSPGQRRHSRDFPQSRELHPRSGESDLYTAVGRSIRVSRVAPRRRAYSFNRAHRVLNSIRGAPLAPEAGLRLRAPAIRRSQQIQKKVFPSLPENRHQKNRLPLPDSHQAISSHAHGSWALCQRARSRSWPRQYRLHATVPHRPGNCEDHVDSTD